MAKEYSIILKGKSISSLISFASKKMNVPIGAINYEILNSPAPPENLFKLKITVKKDSEKEHKKQKLKFSLEETKTKLFLTAFPPENDELPFEVDDVVDLLVTKHKVSTKIDKWEIERAITISTKSKKAIKVLISKGIKPEQGDDGIIELHHEFKDVNDNLAESYIKTPENDLYKCEMIEKDQIIATVHKPKMGKSGSNIYGGTIPGLMGKAVEYSVHNYIICVEFPNRIELRAPDQGRITLYKNLFRFYKVIEQKKPLIGKKNNIKVDGDLIIDEYIENGAKVDVKGNLEVKDDIFNAFVDCHGDLTVENGISNSKKGFISINGNLNCSFLQKALVWVEKDIILSKAILNSQVYGGESISIENEGIIRNSKVSFSSKLVANIIENSTLRGGIPFSAQQRLKRLEINKTQLMKEKDEMEKKIGPSFLNLDIRKLTLENDMLKDVYKKKRELTEINLNLDSLEKEINQLIIKNFQPDCIIAAKLIKMGTIIKMQNDELTIKEDIKNVYITYDIEKKQISIYNNGDN